MKIGKWVLGLVVCTLGAQTVEVSPNHRFLQTNDGKPFFWLGDTSWLLFQNASPEETIKYLDNRRNKGFNVVQVMLLRAENDTTADGVPALTDGDPANPQPGGYWDHGNWVIDRAREQGIHIALVCSWGSLVKRRKINSSNVETYTRFIAERFRSKPNIVWITGGDIRGDENADVWRTMGQTLRKLDPKHLITYHPFGRTQSSAWFHKEPWLDFNMFQSGHRRYEQDRVPGAKGEDNWRYVQEDYALTPVKPTLDGEPSYENLPQGLHDPKERYWDAADARRYAWWSVMAGACGHTYGENAVIQMHKPGRKGVYGVRNYWYEALDAPGAGQIQHLKTLMLSRPYFERIPDESLIASENGTKHDYILATRGRDYAFVYTCTGRTFSVNMGRIAGKTVRAAWFDPRTGKTEIIGTFPNDGTREFNPPGEPSDGNDWTLILDEAKGNG